MPKSVQVALICLLIVLLAIVGGFIGYRMAQRKAQMLEEPVSPRDETTVPIEDRSTAPTRTDNSAGA